MEMAERIADGDVPSDLSVPQRKNLVEFVRVIRVIRVQAKNVRLAGHHQQGMWLNDLRHF